MGLIIKGTISSWWLNQPISKILARQIGSFLGVKIKDIYLKLPPHL